MKMNIKDNLRAGSTCCQINVLIDWCMLALLAFRDSFLTSLVLVPALTVCAHFSTLLVFGSMFCISSTIPSSPVSVIAGVARGE